MGAGALIAAVLLGLPGPVGGGEEPVPVSAESPPLEMPASDPLGFDVAFSIPGWLTSLDGTIGVAGLETDISAGFFDELIDDLDMYAAGRLEFRQGRLGFAIDGFYAKLSADGTSPGPLLGEVSVGIKQVLAEGMLTYRLLEGDRGWLELLAGARYVYLDSDLSLSVEPTQVRSTTDRLAREMADRAAREAAAVVSRGGPGRTDDRVDFRQASIAGVIEDRLGLDAGSARSEIGRKITRSGRVRAAVRELVDASLAHEREAARARASAEAAQARAGAGARASTQRRLAKAESDLSEALEQETRKQVEQANVSASKDWVDPFLGVQGRLRLSDALYVAARADVGGFGVSSDLALNLHAMLGIALGKQTALEVGYRWLRIDYESDEFVYDMDEMGPYLGLRWEF